ADRAERQTGGDARADAEAAAMIAAMVVPATSIIAGFSPGRAGGNCTRDRKSRERRHPKLLHVVLCQLKSPCFQYGRQFWSQCAHSLNARSDREMLKDISPNADGGLCMPPRGT